MVIECTSKHNCKPLAKQKKHSVWDMTKNKDDGAQATRMHILNAERRPCRYRRLTGYKKGTIRPLSYSRRPCSFLHSCKGLEKGILKRPNHFCTKVHLVAMQSYELITRKLMFGDAG